MHANSRVATTKRGLYNWLYTEMFHVMYLQNSQCDLSSTVCQCVRSIRSDCDRVLVCMTSAYGRHPRRMVGCEWLWRALVWFLLYAMSECVCCHIYTACLCVHVLRVTANDGIDGCAIWKRRRSTIYNTNMCMQYTNNGKKVYSPSGWINR